MSAHYYVKRNGEPWREVSKLEFIAAERDAGFIPKAGCGPIATAGFGRSGPDGSIDGKIEYDSPEDMLEEIRGLI